MEKAQQVRSSALSVFIAEANQMNCQLVERALRNRRNRLTVIGSAVSSEHALAQLAERKPDVVVLSAQLKEGPLEGYRVLRQLRAAQSRTRAIMLLDSRDRDFVIDAFRCGARGVIFRDEPFETLGKCIHAVHNGQVWANSENLSYLLDALAQALPMRLQDARGICLLSKREEDVVRLVAQGLMNREISVQLSLSEHTVRNYLFRVFDKLGVSTRVELVLYYLQERQVEPAESTPGNGSSPVQRTPRTNSNITADD
jgi:DNA-binding NarL/FixJ family response regulator